MLAPSLKSDSALKAVPEVASYCQPPHNLEAEQGLLGALLTDNRMLERIDDALRADHFHLPAH